MQSGNINHFKQLSQFTDLKDFNNQFEQWMVDVKGEFTKSELVALKRLVRFSASITGVCYAKIQTVVAATHINTVGISRSTFKRMLTKAKSLGLLVIHNTFKGGKQGHSVYVFNRYVSSLSAADEPPVEEKLNRHKTINLSKTSNIKNNKLRIMFVESNNQLPDQSIKQTVKEPINIFPSWVCPEFNRIANFYFQSQSDITEMYRIALIHSRINTLPSQTTSELAVKALRSLVYKIKHHTKKVRSVRGYFNGICRVLFKQQQLSNLFDDVWNR